MDSFFQKEGSLALERTVATASLQPASQGWNVDFVGCGARKQSIVLPQAIQPDPILSCIKLTK